MRRMHDIPLSFERGRRIAGISFFGMPDSILNGAARFFISHSLAGFIFRPQADQLDPQREDYWVPDVEEMNTLPFAREPRHYLPADDLDRFDLDVLPEEPLVLTRRPSGRLAGNFSVMRSLAAAVMAHLDVQDELVVDDDDDAVRPVERVPMAHKQERFLLRSIPPEQRGRPVMWQAERDVWDATLLNVKERARALADSPTVRNVALFQHAHETYLVFLTQLLNGFPPLSGNLWMRRQLRFWRDVADRSASEDEVALLQEIGGASTVQTSQAAAKALLLLNDPGDMVYTMAFGSSIAAGIASRLSAGNGAFAALSEGDRAFLARALDGFHYDIARRALLGSPGEAAGGATAARVMAGLAAALPLRGGEAVAGEPLIASAAWLYGLRETAPQVLRAFLAQFNASSVASPEIRARKDELRLETWERAKAHPIAAFLDFAGNVANADRLVFASGDDAPAMVAYGAGLAEGVFSAVLGDLRGGRLDETAAAARYAALIADPDMEMAQQAYDAGVAAFRPAPAAALKAAAEVEAELPWLGILLPLVSSAEGILAAARQRPQQAAIAGRYGEALRGEDEGKKYMALVRLGYGLLVTLALLQLAAKGRLGIGGGGADAIGTEGEAGAAMPAPDMTGAAGGVAITAGPLVLPLPANTGPTEMAAMAVRLAPRLDAPLSGDALDAAEQAVAGLLLLAAESFAGDEEPLLDAIIELAGEHEDEVLEERFARFGETIKSPPPAEALAPLRRDTARLVEGLSRG